MSSAQYVYELSRAILSDSNGWIAVFKVYMDESGTHCDSPVVCVSAYLARPSVWKKWTKEWNAAKKPIKTYHAVDCHNRAGEFAGWNREKRDNFVKQLLPILPKYELKGFSVGIDMKSFNNEMSKHNELKELFGNPYTACFQWVCQLILMKIGKEKEIGRKKVAFFHEINDYTREAIESFEWIKNNRSEDIDLVSLSFGEKESYTPLQAADILAYETNHRIKNLKNNKKLSLKAIDPKGEKLVIFYYGEENMSELICKLLYVRDKRKWVSQV